MAAPGKSIAPVRSRHVEERPFIDDRAPTIRSRGRADGHCRSPWRRVKGRRATGHTRAAGGARIPLSFEANLGQSDEGVKFLARMPAYTLFLTSSETVLAFDVASARAGRIATACPTSCGSGCLEPAPIRRSRVSIRCPVAAITSSAAIGSDGARVSRTMHGSVGSPDVSIQYLTRGFTGTAGELEYGLSGRGGSRSVARPYCVRRCGRAADR